MKISSFFTYFVMLALIPLNLFAQDFMIIEDFEDISDFAGLERDGSVYIEGSYSGLWADTVKTKSIKKVFNPPLDLSNYDYFGVWIYSHKANNAKIQLVLDSDNPSDPAGWDYFSKEIVIDFTGFKFIRIPLSEFTVARNPIGWSKINYISFNSDGWGHTPQPDTKLNLDNMYVAKSVWEITGKSQYWLSGDFVYEYTVRMRNNNQDILSLSLDILEKNLQFIYNFSDKVINIPPNSYKDLQIFIVVPKVLITSNNYLNREVATVLLKTQNTIIDTIPINTAVPLIEKEHPYALLDRNDVQRMGDWAQKYVWAKNLIESITKEADNWESNYNKKYGLSKWILPPEGGQWGAYYVCPYDNTYLTYTPPMTHTCPKCKRTFTGWPYDQVIYTRMHNDLSRYALTLAQTYLLNGDLKYANQCKEILLEYALNYKNYPVHDKNNHRSDSGGRVLSQTLDESNWFMNIAWAYEIIESSGVFTKDEIVTVERDLLFEGYRVISKNKAGMSNWQSWHNAALAMIGLAMDDFSIVSEAVYDKNNGFLFQLENSISPDGFWYEGSWGYHFYALRPLVYVAEMLVRSGLDFTNDNSLLSMFRFPILFSEPDGTLPCFNDSGIANVMSYKSLYEIAYRWTDDPLMSIPLDKDNRPIEGLFWGRETIDKSAFVNDSSNLFKDSGYLIMKSNYKSDPVYLALDFGPHGGWHGHYDKLGFVLFALGKEVAVDAGTHSYALPIHDGYDRTTLAHNTVVVDTKNQKEGEGRFDYLMSIRDINLARVGADTVYDGIAQTRRIFSNSNYIVDDFSLKATDNKTHKYDYIIHLKGDFEDLRYSGTYNFEGGDGYSYLKDSRLIESDYSNFLLLNYSDSSGGKIGSYWTSQQGIVASFNVDCTTSFAGNCSGKMQYDFSATQSGYILYSLQIPEMDRGKILGISCVIKGDNSNNSLKIRLYDSTDERFVFNAVSLDFGEWKEIEAYGVENWSHYLGNNDGKVDYPLKSFGVELSFANGGKAISEIYIDEIVLHFEKGDYRLSDFEISTRYIGISSGDTDNNTMTITGRSPVGWGDDVSFLMRRKEAQDARFVNLMCISKGRMEARNCIIKTPPQIECGGTDCDAYYIVFDGTEDILFFAENANSNESIKKVSFENLSIESDGKLAYVSKRNDSYVSYALSDGRTIEINDTLLLLCNEPAYNLFIEFSQDSKRLYIYGQFGRPIKIYAPYVEEAFIDTLKADFTREGDYIIIDETPYGDDIVIYDDSVAIDTTDSIYDYGEYSDGISGEDIIAGDTSELSQNDTFTEDTSDLGDIQNLDISGDATYEAASNTSSGCSCSLME
jgi:hypothetical protein